MNDMLSIFNIIIILAMLHTLRTGRAWLYIENNTWIHSLISALIKKIMICLEKKLINSILLSSIDFSEDQRMKNVKYCLILTIAF